jgi:zinc-ribbon domain
VAVSVNTFARNSRGGAIFELEEFVMFCTQCGTQIDPGKKFCKSCGTRVDRAGEAPATAAPTANEPSRAARSSEAGVRRQQPMPLSPTRDGAASNKTLIIAASVAVVVILAAAGVYFGTDLMRQPAAREIQVTEAPAAKPEESPPLPGSEENKSAAQPGENSQSSLFEPITPESASPPAETAKPLPEVAPKPVPAADVRPAQRRSRVNPAAQPVPASRRGAQPGVYQTLRSTAVFEAPAASAQVVANIPGGVRVNVVNINGDWLEVHSRRGNPPGFIRRDDAQFIEGAQ